MIRVVLADDHSAVRRGIRDFLVEAGDIEVVAEAENGTQALDMIREFGPDIAVLDIQMPGRSGIEVVRQLRRDKNNVVTLILTAFDDPPYIQAALESGANGYVLKLSESDEIVAAVRAAASGQQVFDVRLSEYIPNPSSASDVAKLTITERERAVLTLAAQGLTNKSIGFKLSISDRTVQEHLANVYAKLGAANRTEAVMRAITLDVLKAR